MDEQIRTEVPGAQEHPSLALVDTLIRPGRRDEHDELDTPRAVRDWLLSRDLVDADAELFEYCRGRIVGLREDLRALFSAQADGAVPPAAAVDALNRALTSAPGAMLLRFDPASGFTRSAEHPTTQVVEHAMALLAEDAAALLSGEEATMLACCGADGCEQFFLRTHARRQWCSNRCGDRMRAARAYARKREAQRTTAG